MVRGLDTNSDCTSVAEEIVNEGFNFVGRYYANAGKKRLTLTEARALGVAGIKIVAIWEDGYPTKASYFSYAKGLTIRRALITTHCFLVSPSLPPYISLSTLTLRKNKLLERSTTTLRVLWLASE